MAFLGNLDKIFFGKKSSKTNTRFVPLQEVIPNFQIRINAQVNLLEETVDFLQARLNTSLDVLLRRGIGNLRTSIMEYARILEQILIARDIISVASGARKRGSSEIVGLAVDSMKFYGGEKVVSAARFLNSSANSYLAQMDEREFAEHVQGVKADFEILRLFILKN